MTAYRRYLEECEPREFLFECSYQLLNSIVERPVSAVRLGKPESLQMHRDTFAVRQLRKGVKPQVLMKRLVAGTWLEARERYSKLAGVDVEVHSE